MRILVPLLMLTGCGLAHRQLKFFGPEQVAIRAEREQGLLVGEIERPDGIVALEPARMTSRDGASYLRPVVLSDRDTLVLGTRASGPVALEIYLRSNGLFDRHDFQPITTITGSLDRRYPNEVVMLPTRLDEGPVALSVADLDNIYNNYSYDHGDSLLIVARSETNRERLLFRRRDAGIYFSGFAGVLATIPLREDQRGVAPILAGGVTMGWRTRRSAGPMLVFDPLELVVSGGIGSTALDGFTTDNEVALGQQLQGVFNAALVGGGVRLFRVITVQGFVNTTQFFRNADEAPATLAVGVDAAGLAAATRDIFGRLLRENRLRRPPPRKREPAYH